MKFTKVLTVVCIIGFVAILGMSGFAAEEEVEVHKKSWWDLFQTTGPVGIMLVAVSVAGTALSIQYAVNLRQEKLGPPHLISELETLLAEKNFEQTLSICDADRSYLARIVAGAVVRGEAGYEEMKKGMEESISEEAFRLNAKISYIALIGNIAPLLGLLGTVTGMVTSFQKIEQMKSPTPADLATGVYESLVNTTMGLFAAIVFLTIAFFMKNKISAMTLSLNTIAGELLSRSVMENPQQ
ncbi:MAG: MotA/TolQ/ExbB proton channel family protein [Candidatus Brocadiae bacterium]|nr:MotA/TolQ/ExbB proton channel family protein [Candidatus Brocadiia bacterium]